VRGGALSGQRDSSVPRLLEQLLTPGLFRALPRREFLTLARAPSRLRRPTLVWGSDFRKVLRDQLHQALDKLGSGEDLAWTPEGMLAVDGYRYTYKELCTDLIVDDVHVSLFCEHVLRTASTAPQPSPSATGSRVSATPVGDAFVPQKPFAQGFRLAAAVRMSVVEALLDGRSPRQWAVQLVHAVPDLAAVAAKAGATVAGAEAEGGEDAAAQGRRVTTTLRALRYLVVASQEVATTVVREAQFQAVVSALDLPQLWPQLKPAPAEAPAEKEPSEAADKGEGEGEEAKAGGGEGEEAKAGGEGGEDTPKSGRSGKRGLARQQELKARPGASLAEIALLQERAEAALVRTMEARGSVAEPLPPHAAALLDAWLELALHVVDVASAASALAAKLPALTRLLHAEGALRDHDAHRVLALVRAVAALRPAGVDVGAKALDMGLLPLLVYWVVNGSPTVGPELRVAAARALAVLVATESKGLAVRGPSAEQSGTLTPLVYVLAMFEPLFAREGSVDRERLLSGGAKPKALVQQVDEQVESPELLWNDDMRQDLVRFLRRDIADFRVDALVDREEGASASFGVTALTALSRYQRARPTLQRELVVGGIFIRLFLANPAQSLSLEPPQFLMALFKRLRAERDLMVTASARAGGGGGGEADAEAEAERASAERYSMEMLRAVLALLDQHTELAEQFASADLDALTFAAKLLHPSVPDKVQATLLEILDTVVKNKTVAVAMAGLAARPTVEPFLPRLLGACLRLRERQEGGGQVALQLVRSLAQRQPKLGRLLMVAGAAPVLGLLMLENGAAANGACAAISALCNAEQHGRQATHEFCRLLTPNFEPALRRPAAALLEFAHKDHTYTPAEDAEAGLQAEREWNAANRAQVQEALRAEAEAAVEKAASWDGATPLWTSARVDAIFPDPEPEPEAEEEEAKGEAEEAKGGEAEDGTDAGAADADAEAKEGEAAGVSTKAETGEDFGDDTLTI